MPTTGARSTGEGRAAEAGGPDARNSTSRALLLTLVVADVAFAFQQSGVVPAIDTVRQDLGGGQEWATWLLSVYLMVATVATPALGRFADLHGRRLVLLWTLAVFVVGSVVAAAAPSLPVLVGARAVQGVGGAVFPLTLSLAREDLPQEQGARGSAWLTGAFGAGTVLGFVGSGALTEYLSWRLIFALGAVLIAAAAVLAARTLPRVGGHASGDFDTLGTVLLGVAAIALLVVLTVGAQSGWTSWPVLALVAVTVVAAAGWVGWERHRRDPLVDLSLFRTRAVLRVNVATLALGWALFAAYLLVPRLVQADPSSTGYGLRASAFGVGLLMLPVALAQTAVGPLTGTLGRRVRPGLVLAGALLAMCASAVVLGLVQRSTLGVVVGTALLGVGAGAGIQASSAVSTNAVDPDVVTAASAVNSTVRRFAGGLGSQAAVILLLSSGSAAAPPHSAFTVAFAVSAVLALAGAAVAVTART